LAFCNKVLFVVVALERTAVVNSNTNILLHVSLFVKFAAVTSSKHWQRIPKSVSWVFLRAPAQLK